MSTFPIASQRPAFDVAGPLPTGMTVLEASAGTGKTYTIAALAARYVAEGHAELSDLMLVTFGRMATNELRLRVRERLVSLERQLAAALAREQGTAAEPVGTLDAVERLLTDAPPQELALRHGRVAKALAEFDSATIATTHEFCLQMLNSLGVLGDREPQTVVIETLTDLTREVTGDVYLRRYAPSGVAPLTYQQALSLAAVVVEASHTELVPRTTEGSAPAAAELLSFAAEVRDEVWHRKRSNRLFTYDDMLTRLRDTLADAQHGQAAADRLRSRFSIVMVDEFQDTDPIQWEILRRAFAGHSTLIMIGDPKQAIYAFRGADVFSYLEAVTAADRVETLATNWRSDQALIDALDTLYGGATLGDPRIVVRPVTADHAERRLASAGSVSDPLTAPVRLRFAPHAAGAIEVPAVRSVRADIVTDLVADVTTVLASGATVTLHGRQRVLGPKDIAVLVRKNERGETIRDALVAAGVPAVMLGATSVYDSNAALDWLTLLKALEQPRQPLVRRAALTDFVGWSFRDLVAADEDALTDLTQQIRRWSRLLAGRGVAALLETITTDTRLPERLLAHLGGERGLTDVRHLAQSLHAAAVAGQLGVSALVVWLGEQIAEARRNSLSEGTRRLETDAEAVTVLTVHRSKGLEFPIVYLPEAWDRHVNSRDEGGVLRLHEQSSDPDAPVRSMCVLDVGGLSGAGRAERFARHHAEEAGEDLRLLYVALTRAQCQVVAWWAPSRNTPASALHRMLFRGASSPSEHGSAPELKLTYPLEGDPQSCSRLAEGFSIEPMSPRTPLAWRPAAGAPPLLDVRDFVRTLDLAWRRTSYSALTAAVHGLDAATAGVGSEAESVKEDDETQAGADGLVGLPPVVDDPALRLLSPMRDLPSGVVFGTAVHAIFEAVDPQAADLAAELRRASADTLARVEPSTLASGTPTPAPMTSQALSAALLPVMLTPLGPLADDRRLCDIGAGDRLPELPFEFPLAGGESTTAKLTLGDVAPLLDRHLPADDRLAGYPALLTHPSLADQPLRGYLNGSIDAVLRIGEPSGAPRYLVIDYKTNWLGGFDGQQLTVGDYVPSRLAEAMMSAHYPLQALLYSVAVHRFLRWRQVGYAPATHLGGVLYLFVRGMAGPDTPRVDGVPCGVFSWRPPADLICDLSDLLDRGPRRSA